MLIDDEAFEFSILKLKQLCPEPEKSIHGNQSLTWQVFRYSCCLWGGLRAALLQIALPQVAQAIKDHSRIKEEPYERLRRTFFFVSQANYGPQRLAIETARRLRSYHCRINGKLPNGTDYSANEETAIFWVHGTIVDTGIFMYEKLKQPLSIKEKDQLIQELYKSALLMGLHREDYHKSWKDFCFHFRHIQENKLGRITATQDIAGVLLKANMPFKTLMNYLIALTADSLDPNICEIFQLQANPIRARRLYKLLQKIYEKLPDSLQWMPPYWEVQSELNRKIVQRLLVSGANKLMLGQKSIIRNQ